MPPTRSTRTPRSPSPRPITISISSSPRSTISSRRASDLILVNAADPRAIAPAVKRAQAAGIPVIAVDVAAAGADATVQTDNTRAGEIACQFMAEKMGGKGNVIIENGPQVSAVIDRVNGCKAALAKAPAIKILSSDQDAKGSREGGMNAMQGYLTRFPDIQGVFTINDPQAIGTDLAARQLNRSGIVITSVDGAPDIVGALKGPTQVQASASQDPYTMGKLAVQIGDGIIKRQEAGERHDPDGAHLGHPRHRWRLSRLDALSRMGPVICLGELLIDFVPTGAGDLQTAATFQKAAGGAPQTSPSAWPGSACPAPSWAKSGDDPGGRGG